MTRLQRVGKDEKAQSDVINSVIVLGVVGIAIGIMVMIFAAMEPTILGSAAETMSETWLTTNNGSYDAVNYTMYDPPSVVLYNGTTTFTEGVHYTVSASNSSIVYPYPVDGSYIQNGTVYYIDYKYQGTGYASVAGVNENVYKGFDLGSIAPLIMGATLVITIVMGMAAGFMMRKD